MAYKFKSDFHACNHLRGRSFSLHADFITTTTTGNYNVKISSPTNLIFEGNATGQVITLPNATDECIFIGHEYCIFNDSEENIVVRDNELNVIATLIPGTRCCFFLKDQLTPAGEWGHGKIPLSKVLIDQTNIVGISGGDAQEFIENYLSIVGLPCKNEIPTGLRNCDNLEYFLSAEAIAGTMEITLDGRKLTPLLDYTENPDGLGFTLLINDKDSNRLNSPPNDREEILVSYCKRVIF